MTPQSIISDHIRERRGRDVEVEPGDSFASLGVDDLDLREICIRCEEAFNLPREIREAEILTVEQLIGAVERMRACEPAN